MKTIDEQYLEVLQELVVSSAHVEGRNGGVTTHFGKQLIFEDVGTNFPILLSKKIHFKSVMVELLWFIKGMTNTDYLHKHGVTIWDEWADKNGELGPVYGAQWRKWLTNDQHDNGDYKIVDQLKDVIQRIKNKPYDRRLIVSAWNPAEIDSMALPPCHMFFQFHVRPTGELDIQMYQRSADWFLGVPFNITSYALLLILVAREVGRVPGKLVHTFGNYHLYDNHLIPAKIHLGQANYQTPYKPNIMIKGEKSIWDLEPENITLYGYNPAPAIKAEVSK